MDLGPEAIIPDFQSLKIPFQLIRNKIFDQKLAFFMYMCQEQPIKSWTFPIILNSNLISRTIWHLVMAEKAPSSLFVSILHLMPQGSWKEQVQLEDVFNLVFPLLTFIYIIYSTLFNSTYPEVWMFILCYTLTQWCPEELMFEWEM